MKMKRETIEITCSHQIRWQVEVMYYLGYSEECEICGVPNSLGYDISEFLSEEKLQDLENAAHAYMQERLLVDEDAAYERRVDDGL